MSFPSNESVYNLIPRPPPPRIRPPRHKSKFSENVKSESKQSKTASKTMGPAKVKVNPPQEYLTSHSKEPRLPEKKLFKYPDSDSCKPAVPSHSDKPQMGSKTTKNFITTNAVNNIMSVPRKPAPKYVDTVMGTRCDMEDSGLMPKYVTKKDYGQVPHYLERRKEEMTAAQKEYEEYIAESMRRGQMDQVDIDQREELLAGLKKNWEELHHQYQGLSVVTDTATKKARKERMEAAMKQLEKDIELIERHKVIYIAKEQQQPNFFS